MSEYKPVAVFTSATQIRQMAFVDEKIAIYKSTVIYKKFVILEQQDRKVAENPLVTIDDIKTEGRYLRISGTYKNAISDSITLEYNHKKSDSIKLENSHNIFAIEKNTKVKIDVEGKWSYNDIPRDLGHYTCTVKASNGGRVCSAYIEFEVSSRNIKGTNQAVGVRGNGIVALNPLPRGVSSRPSYANQTVGTRGIDIVSIHPLPRGVTSRPSIANSNSNIVGNRGVIGSRVPVSGITTNRHL